MASKKKSWVGGAASLSQAWAYTPPVSANAPIWTLTLNSKSLTYISAGNAADAVAGMQKLWQASNEPEFQEISASVPTLTDPPDSPQGAGTNEIQAIYITGNVTGGSFQIGWEGSSTPFLSDPASAPAGVDAGVAGSPNGSYLYTVTFLNQNALGQIGETNASPESASVSVTSHKVTLTIPTAPALLNANQVCIGRRIYRTAAGGASGTEKLVTTIWDNTTTTYTDNLADGSLGAVQPTSNSTGIPYNATAAQLQGILQSLASIAPGNLVVTGAGTPASPWLAQFTGTLGAEQQPNFTQGAMKLNATVTVPAGPAVKLVVSEIQQGVKANATPPGDGQTLLLIGKSGIPFYLTSTASGSVPPVLTVSPVTQTLPPSQQQQAGQITISETPASITVQRTVTALAGVNEAQQITISPNAISPSTFTLSWGGNTTGAIPVPPPAPSAVSNGAGNLAASAAANYYWLVTFLTATGETEPSAPSTVLNLGKLTQATVTIPTGPSVVTKRRVYRTQANGAITGPYYLVGTVNDNTSTTFSDNVADSTIATNPPPPTTNGVLQGELEALPGVGTGNVQVSGANFPAVSGMTLQQAFPGSPPVVATALSATGQPTIDSVVALSGGGQLTPGTYFYEVTAIDTQGETIPASGLAGEQSATVLTHTGRAIITWVSATGATGYKIYRGTASNSENELVGIVASSATTFIDYGGSPAPIVYNVEFVGSLQNSAQSLLTGSSASVALLPTITIAETQVGYPVQNEIQAVGWTQEFGINSPVGTLTISLPALKVTTGPIGASASPTEVLAAIQKVVPLAYYHDFSVTAVKGNTGAFIWAITYQGGLGAQEIPLATINLAGMTAATGDSLSPYAVRAQVGSPVGRNEIATVTLNDGPGGGTFSLTGTLAGGNTITATGLAYNASAATVQAGFPVATVSVSGSAGGPYTIEAIGEAGSQKVVWSAADSLTSGAASPPVSNTTALPAPTGLTASYTHAVQNPAQTQSNWPATGTWYFVVCDVGAGFTIDVRSNEISFTIDNVRDTVNITTNHNNGEVAIFASQTPGSYPAGSLVCVLNLSVQQINDIGYGVVDNTSIPGSLGTAATISANGLNTPGGVFSAGTYFWKVTAKDAQGETTGSNEVSLAIEHDDKIQLLWNAVAGATSYNVYRSTSAGGEGTSPALVVNINGTIYNDTGAAVSAGNVPVSNTTALPAPTQSAPSTSASGGSMASGTYFYEVTATNAHGETTVSNEESIAVTGPTGEVTVNWAAITGATGYRIYRGTTTGQENTRIGTITNGSTTSFVDTTASGASAVPATLAVAELASGVVPRNDTQAITLTNVGGGTWGLQLGNEVATEIAFNVTAATLQSTLQLLPNIGSGNCTVTETASGGSTVYTITFVSALASQAQPLFIPFGNASFVKPPTVNTLDINIPVASDINDITGQVEYTVENLGAMGPPTNVQAQAQLGGKLAAGTYYYVITTLNVNIPQITLASGVTVPSQVDTGESTGSTEVSATVLGGSQAGISLSWTAPKTPDSAPKGVTPVLYNIYRGTTPGEENQLIATVQANIAAKFLDDGSEPIQRPSLLPGGEYVLTLSPGTTDTFTLSYAGQTTGSISATATAATIQSDLAALSTIGAGNVVVTGNAGGPWNIGLTTSVAGAGTLSGAMDSIPISTTASFSSTFAIDVQDATSGTFTLSFGQPGAQETTGAIAYNATPATVQTSLAALQNIGDGNATVIGSTGGPFLATITTNAQTAGYAMTGDDAALVGSSGSFAVYPVVYAYATGPNFYDAPSNWADGSPPSIYLSAPVIAAVVPIATDSTLVAGTHGSLNANQTYYYVVTATNANGETVGSGESSGASFAGAKVYFNGTPSAGTFSLTYGGQTASGIAFNASAATIQGDLNALSSISANGGSCSVTGAGTLASPFVFTLTGTLTGTAPSGLTANGSGLTGATISVLNSDMRSLAVSWSEIAGATGYKVYRGTTAGSENVLVATLLGQDRTTFIDDGTYTTTAASPPTDTNAWHTAVGDDVYFANSSVSCLYNIAASVVNGYSVHGGFNGLDYVQVNSLFSDASFTGYLCPPVVNPAGYAEYRPTLMQIMGPPGEVFPIAIGNGSGNGSPSIGLDTGTCQIAMSILTLAPPVGSQPVAMTWIGDNAASEIDLFFGSLGIALYPGQTAQLGTLKQAYQQNPNGDTALIVGAGCAAIPTFTKSGGTTTLFANVTTLQGKGGTVNQQAGAVTGTLNLVNCTYISQSTASLGTVNVAGGGLFDRSHDSRALSLGALNLYAGASYQDPHGCTVTTGQGYLDYDLVQCGYEDVTLVLGKNVSGRRTQN